MQKTAVITGITGQDASYLAELLLSKDYRVVGISRRTSTANDARIAHLYANPNFIVEQGDITDALAVYRLINAHNPDEVYNLAAQSDVGVSFKEPAHTAAVTGQGAMNILEACRQHGGAIRFYQASSSEMYGSMYSMAQEYDEYEVIEHFDGNLRSFEDVWSSNYCGDTKEKRISLMKLAANKCVKPAAFQNETTPMRPNSPYAIAKLSAHHACRMYRDAYGMFVCSGILYNHESERRGEKFVTRKISKYVGQMLRTGNIENMPVLRLGNTAASRDWGHAEDYVRAMWLMLQQPTADDYVVATGEVHTVQEFLEAAFAVAGMRPDELKKYVSVGDARLLRPSEVGFLRGDASKARKVLGWQPAVAFNDLVIRMVLSDSRPV